EIGKKAKIISVAGEGQLRHHILDMGLIPGTVVTLVKYAPMGDPMELLVRGYELTLRVDDAKLIGIEPVSNAEKNTDSKNKSENNNLDKAGKEKNSKKSGSVIEHPGLGEGGRYHVKEHENPLPDTELLTFGLLGNQNCGKTTLFNQVTGSNQHVGNFPGVTVDRKSGMLRENKNTEITDLPGIYSLSPYSNEEIVTREFVLNERPKGIINIVDATNIERNLYLTMQLMELDIPMVLALNMMDEMTGNGGTVYINKMESLLGIPVVPISAAKNEGVDELVAHAIHVAKFQESPGRQDFCEDGPVHRCIHGVIHLIEDHAKRAGIPVRFAATKLIEGDEIILDMLNLSENEKEMLEHIIVQLEEEEGLDAQAQIAGMRYDFIEKLVRETVKKPQESREHLRSEKIDKILTGKYTAIPSFVLIMSAVFVLTFNVIGAFFQGILENAIELFIESFDKLLAGLSVNDTIRSLVVDGVLTGVGNILSFLPIIVILFFFLSLLEDTGYMARVAFVMDKLLRKIGLSGRSIVPLLIGFGCSVPGVMASRTLPSERDRKMTILLTPFMSCSAKLPIYAFFTAAFFKDNGGLVMILLYFIGIAVGILVALILKSVYFKGEAVPFVMELPNYRLPGMKNVVMLLWDKAKDFLQRAFTVIFLASIVIWFLQRFNFTLNMVTDSKDSILAEIAGIIAPVFSPMGYGDWRVCTALVTGFIAKESVVSTLFVLYGTKEAVLGAMSMASAFSLLVFCLLYTPCVATIAVVKRELGAKWASVVVLGQCIIAWIVAYAAYLIMQLF
ncbi:MAG: ferrous iron transport protein B, partial [Lachnospiraceae bacterium]|nr:ferrous iron transport protein B [Lachnospiraceae bacterium]